MKKHIKISIMILSFLLCGISDEEYINLRMPEELVSLLKEYDILFVREGDHNISTDAGCISPSGEAFGYFYLEDAGYCRELDNRLYKDLENLFNKNGIRTHHSIDTIESNKILYFNANVLSCCSVTKTSYNYKYGRVVITFELSSNDNKILYSRDIIGFKLYKGNDTISPVNNRYTEKLALLSYEEAIFNFLYDPYFNADKNITDNNNLVDLIISREFFFGYLSEVLNPEAPLAFILIIKEEREKYKIWQNRNKIYYTDKNLIMLKKAFKINYNKIINKENLDVRIVINEWGTNLLFSNKKKRYYTFINVTVEIYNENNKRNKYNRTFYDYNLHDEEYYFKEDNFIKSMEELMTLAGGRIALEINNIE